MSVVIQWLLRIAGGMVVLSLAGIALVYYLASRSLPDYDKTLAAAGVSAPVEIVRNNANVPHIFAESDGDAFFALGYAHAQDRLWQMVTLRRTAQGRLSEVFGPRTLRIDKLLRRLDFYTLSVQSTRYQDARTAAALRAYSNGVNTRIDEINRDSLGRGAPEMFLFQSPVAPWQPADSIAIQKLMALQLSGHLEEEVLRARVSLLLPDAARLADVLPEAPGTGVAALPEYAALVPGTARFAETTALPRHPLSPFKPRALAGASNAWAAAASRSASGGTLLANDPHLGLSAPSIWYLARLELSTGGVIGGTIPGIPAVLSGRNDGLGWGLTSAYLDDQDVFIEALNPDNPEEYRSPDGYKPFVTRKSIINVAGEAPVTITLRWTDNGPVLPAGHYSLGTVTPKDHVAALGWTALSAADTSLSAAIGVMYADTVQEAIAAGEAYISPAQNLILADRDTVAMKTVGAMPRRAEGHVSKGRLPSLGWMAQNRWRGRLPYASNPEFISPTGGIVGNTNNKTLERPFPLHVSYVWGDTQRIQRWQRLMQGRQVHTRDSFV
ncbi:penicillin acylase family protein, partial [Shimia sp.]|uniref:penicillin acylase family protein n=1 Tax=Shimia sp. TaxID=1954381 RepID=UPI00356847BF